MPTPPPPDLTPDLPPPEDPGELRAWADARGISGRLDDVVIGLDGPPGTFLPARNGEVLTYRRILLEGAGKSARRGFDDTEETARRMLHRMATLVAARRQRDDWLEQHGREPEDEILAAFAAKLGAALRQLSAAHQTAPRPVGTYEPDDVRVIPAPVPMLQYREWPLVRARRDGDDGSDGICVFLLGWNDGPLRWGRARGQRAAEVSELPAEVQQSALQAIIDELRDPRRVAQHEALAELLRVPAWQFALGTLDQTLSRLEAAAGPTTDVGQERVAFRVTAASDGSLTIAPTIQKRVRGGGYSRGARVQWYELPERATLTASERRAYQAYDDRFARRSAAWGGSLSPAQVFGILRALIDHPAVFLNGGRDSQQDGPRLDIRQGRLLLRFTSASDGDLSPHFALLGETLLPTDVAAALRDDRHVIHLFRPDAGAPQVLLAQIGPQAAAMVRALALAPARFPPESHDALAARLESLQETVDIEFPSTWTRTIAAADGRLVARLQLAASGALEVRLGVRPVRLGPVFVPGEGPALVLEGQGRDRHGARRDRATERQNGHALAESLGLENGTVLEPWCWRVPEGDPALHLVAILKDLGDTVVVEWADEHRLLSLGTVGRRDMRMKVADRRDWFDIEGGAQIKKRRLGQGSKDAGKGKDADETVPLAALFAAIRDGRRYVTVGAHGFVRIEESLREALARAEGGVFEKHGVIQIAAVASDSLLGLVEEEDQLEASAAFTALRRRLRVATAAIDDPLRLPAALQAALRPYQAAGAAWMARLAAWGAGAILADEMGLGKTIQTLALLTHRAAAGPALVVAPTSVVSNWADEAARFAPQLGVRLYRGPQREAGLRGLRPGDLVLTSYAVAALDAEALAGVRFASLVLDEAQAIKNATTERAKALRALDAEWRLGLTGTPIENHLGELWSLMRVLSPGLLGSWEQFRARYAVPIEKFGDDSRRRALAALLRPFVLRRTKTEVARELPARTEVVRVVRLSPEEQALYEQMRKATLDELHEAKKNPERDGRDLQFVLLAALTRLRQLCCHPRLLYPHTHAGSSKATHLLDLLFELREGGHKALVFSQFRSFLELLAPRLRQQNLRVLVLDGTTPTHVRDERIAAFQQGRADVFLISLKAGGFGLNLTAADTVILMDPWWNPAVEDQATARAHRIGQQQPVTTVRLVARGTIEEAVLSLHAAKRALAAGVLHGTDVAASLASDELVALIQRGGDLND